MAATATPPHLGLDRFVYPGLELDRGRGEAVLRYELAGPGGRGLHFAERLRFSRPWPRDEARREAADRALRLLYLVAGVSYYKAALPGRLVVGAAVAPSEAELGFLERTFRGGLAELLHRNRLGLELPLQVEAEAPSVAAPLGALPLGAGPLVPVGGGKDSAVTIELVRAAGEVPLLFSLNRYPPIERTAEAAGLDLVSTGRRLDPALGELNRAGAINGHVPITALYCLAAAVEALLHGRGAVLLSNERSASVPTLWHGGVAVNHQYSKSFAFEADLAATLDAVLGHGSGLAHLSLLRPLSELAILQVFSGYDRYHGVFTSCNRVFRIDEARRPAGWCGDCDKCRFVALGLSPFLPRHRVAAILGRDLLDDATQLDGFRELLGLSGERPFECVGTVEECRVALHLAARRPELRGAAVVAALAPEVAVGEDEVRATFELATEHRVPPRYLEAIRASLRPAG